MPHPVSYQCFLLLLSVTITKFFRVVPVIEFCVGGGIWTTISVTLEPQFQQFDNFRAAPALWLVTSACGDVAITVCLVYSLVSQYFQGTSETNSLGSPKRRQASDRRMTILAE